MLSRTHGGANFTGAQYLWHPDLNDGITPAFSPQGVISYWPASSQFATGTILASCPYFPTLGSYAPGIIIQHLLLGSQTYFWAYLSDGGQTNFQEWFGAVPLSQDGAQHHIAFTFDTSHMIATWSYDGIQQGWDPNHSAQSGGSFSLSANSIAWTVGAVKNPVNGNGQNYYVGYLGELYGHFFPSDYDMLHAPNPVIKRGFAQRFPLPGTSTIVFGPLDLGPGCANIFGAAASPLLCQRGMPADFIKDTAGGAFQVIGPAMSAALTNPFDLIP